MSRLTESPHRGARHTRIVVAEDDKDWRDLLELALRRKGYDVVTVSDGNTLCEVIACTLTSLRLDGARVIIVADVLMPGLSGVDALKLLREKDTDTPVILMSAFADDRLTEEALALGANAVFSKPLAIPDLVRKIRELAEA